MLEKMQFKLLEYNRSLLNKLYDKEEKRLDKYGLSLEMVPPSGLTSGLIALLEGVEWFISYGLLGKEKKDIEKNYKTA
jgi:hypothetical protein